MDMHHRLVALALIGSAVAMSACGSSSAASEVTAGPTPAPTAAPVATTAGDGVGSIGDAIEVAAGAPGQATDAACDVDRRTLETATELYFALNGTMPTSQAELVAGKMIVEPSPRFVITPDGTISPAPGSTCT
ncbi:MAG: hypothetical protein WBP59_08015 [Ilumatobacteraceae bacterium]